MWYNEEFLAPYFLKHYAWADRITLLYDQDTTDNTRQIAAAYPNVHITPFRFPDQMDDVLKSEFISKAYADSKADWVLSVDADEFVFFKKSDEFCYDLPRYLEEKPGYDLFFVALFQIYRHAGDKELDPALPAIPQRRHGDPNVSTGMNRLYNKPILIRGGLDRDIAWTPGCHEVRIDGFEYSINSHGTAPIAIAPEILPGAHWAMADPDFAVERRVKNRRLRQSRNNLENKLTVQHHNVTVKSIMKEFAEHANDPQVF